MHVRVVTTVAPTPASWPNQVDTSSHNLGPALGEVPEPRRPQDEAEGKDDRRSTDIPSFRSAADHLSRGATQTLEGSVASGPYPRLPNNLLAGAEM